MSVSKRVVEIAEYALATFATTWQAMAHRDTLERFVDKPTYLCPVCGYLGLYVPPTDYTICPCCATEFGNDDFEYTHEELRQRWVDSGMKWWARYEAPPDGWNPQEQLKVFA